MKNIIKNITLCGLIAAGTGLGFSSCEDFLTITPTDRIVEEEFWEDKNDLDNAVMACYRRMAENDMLIRYIYWGEERSDNFERSTNSSDNDANIIKANLLPTYGQFNWTAVYNTINYCNKVLAHGPEIVLKDQSFSEAQWRPIKAEVIALRSLCHFYLVRTFGEVPYVTTDYNNDSQELRQAQSTQLTVLNNIIDDLESVMENAPIDYGTTAQNKGRITRQAIYALLADTYLWRASYKTGNNHPFTKITLAKNYNGEFKDLKVNDAKTEVNNLEREEAYTTTAEEDYDACIIYCNKVLDIEMSELADRTLKDDPMEDLTSLTEEDLLIANVNKKTGYNISPSAYTRIFGQGNSTESIFELQVDGVSCQNTMVGNLFSTKEGKAGVFTGTTSLFNDANENPNIESDYVFSKTDYRRWNSFIFTSTQESFNIAKYVYSTITQQGPLSKDAYLTSNKDKSLTTGNIGQSVRSTNNANWIFYRMSDIFLMKAEAISQRYDDEENLTEGFHYVRDVFKRSNPYAYDKQHNTNARNDSLKPENFKTQEALERLVLNERQREFYGEGKRWFDLVRYALRRGGTAEMLKIYSKKKTDDMNSIKVKLAHIQSLFSPIYNTEIKNNSWLYQNGVWSVNETSSRTEDL
ncbi:MAG: RagB/SusD family nutrient uptake outer membrane protein [Bacteroidaceae bacterium]|nr:RagB/SusD family nutrient uptake outer membrane protein [Bacteroidaceae bacterium]